VNSLFRSEALKHREGEWLGSIQLIRPVSFSVLTGLCVFVALALGAYLVIGEYTRKARLTGYLVPDLGIIRLVSPQPAVVVESHVAEGKSVRQGDVLFVLAVGQATVTGDTQAAVQDSLALRERSLHDALNQREQLTQAQLGAVDRQIDELQRDLDAMKAEVDLQTQRLVLAEQAQHQYESLRNENFVSAAQVRSKMEEVLNVRAQLQGLQRQRAARLRDIAALQSQRRELPMHAQAAHGEIDRELAALAQQSAESQARQRLVVRAPQDGLVSGVVAQVGQAVVPAVALASLLPAGAKLQARLYATSSAVGFLRARQPVQLRYQAFPYQKFGHQSGVVSQVSLSPLQPSELAGEVRGGRLRPAVDDERARQPVADHGAHPFHDKDVARMD